MSNLSLTRSNFLFLFRSFLYNFTLDNSNLGKSSVLKSKTWNLFQNKRVNTLSLLFCHPSSNSLSIPVYINQALLINSFFFFFQNINLYLLLPLKDLEVRCAWYLHSLPIHLLISLLLVTWFASACFELPSISLEGLSYRESTVLLLNTHCMYVNETFDMDKVGETRRHQWKERLNISKFS